MKKLALTLALSISAVVVASAQAIPHSTASGLSNRPVCAAVGAGHARCDSHVVTDSRGRPFKGGPPSGGSSGPAGYWPTDLRSAYKLTTDSTATVAIVDAYDDPNAASDLAVYRQKFGLPACGTGCFTKLNQNGVQGSYPNGNTGWGQEISLDLDMASAICPSCHIVLVEANSNSFNDLAAAVDTAAALNPAAISNSYGGSEFSAETSFEGHYNHPGVTVSSGDSGYGVEFPASSRYVTAVGGTSLTKASNARGWSETAWSGAGSGCSAYVPKPAWQADGGCAQRTVADVSAVANPNTGVAVYDTYGSSGWLVFGGTSVAAPIVAGVYALADNTGTFGGASFAYGQTSSLFDVVSGSNSRRGCSPAYLCTATSGYDGPTGLGTPNGIGAF